jgi:hypothetical protein
MPAGRTIAILVLFAAAALVGAQVAPAFFNKAATGGPLTVATSTLSPPGGVSATQVNCRNNKPVEIEVAWSATSSGYATSYTVERAGAAGGPYTALSSVPIAKTSYIDSGESPAYSTTYYYRVTVMYRSWSATSASASVKTLSRLCA